MSHQYESIPIDLYKGEDVNHVDRKKKKKDKERELSKMYENIATNASTSDEVEGARKIHIEHRTKAEISFEKAQDKKMAKQILEKASKSHKERVSDFNHHLDSLTEHFDIPKVSWTK